MQPKKAGVFFMLAPKVNVGVLVLKSTVVPLANFTFLDEPPIVTSLPDCGLIVFTSNVLIMLLPMLYQML